MSRRSSHCVQRLLNSIRRVFFFVCIEFITRKKSLFHESELAVTRAEWNYIKHVICAWRSFFFCVCVCMCVRTSTCVANVLPCGGEGGGRIFTVYFGIKTRARVRVSWRCACVCLFVCRSANKWAALELNANVQETATKLLQQTECIVVHKLVFVSYLFSSSSSSSSWVFRIFSSLFCAISIAPSFISEKLETFHRRFCTRTSRICAMPQIERRKILNYSNFTLKMIYDWHMPLWIREFFFFISFRLAVILDSH